MVINVIENKNEPCTVWNRVVVLKTPRNRRWCVKEGGVTINPLHSLFSLVCWPASKLRLLLVPQESIEVEKVYFLVEKTASII
jgi:hypothetical protein